MRSLFIHFYGGPTEHGCGLFGVRPRPCSSRSRRGLARLRLGLAYTARAAITGIARPLLTTSACASAAISEGTDEGFFKDLSSLVSNRMHLRYGISIVDVDNDGVFEAFVCGYGGLNSLYCWTNGKLEDVAAQLE